MKLIIDKPGNRKADLRRNWPVTVKWGELPGGYKSPIFFNHRVELIETITSYCLQIADKNARCRAGAQSHKSAIDRATSALKSFVDFTLAHCLKIDEIEDNHLEAYREWELTNVRSKKSSRDDLSSKRTVNIKLREVYNFYIWAQEKFLIFENHIGIGDKYKIQSLLTPDRKSTRSASADDNRRYPLCYKRVGSSGQAIDYVATENDLHKLREYFNSGKDGYAAERNILIMDIVEAVGWRQGSVQSLTVDNFLGKKIIGTLNTADAVVTVKPKKQKFGYQFDFEFPEALIYRIQRHIEYSRSELLLRKNITEEELQEALFLSSVTGKPLADSALTQLFSKAFSAINCPRGSGIHSIRRKFTSDDIRVELETRVKKKLSTAPADVTHGTKRKLGHESELSLAAYYNASKTLTSTTIEYSLKEEVLMLKGDLAERERDNRELKDVIRKLKIENQKLRK